jgi:short-subunit dehydrogenase
VVLGRSPGPSHPNILSLQVDLSHPESAQSVRDLAELANASPDLLVCNAGFGEIGSVEETSEEAARALWEVNYWSHVALCRQILPALRERGSGKILFVSSLTGRLPFPFKAQYSASKAALTAFALALRQEVSPWGLQVGVVEPGWIRSAFHGRLPSGAPPGSPYATAITPFLDHRRDEDPSTQDGEAVAGRLMMLIEGKRLPARMLLGRDAWASAILIRLLPWGWVDRLLGAYLKRKARRGAA